MSHTNGTTITLTNASGTVSTTTTDLWTAGMSSLLEGNWTTATDNLSMSNSDLKLKSNKWVAATGNDAVATVTGNDIGASIVIGANGQMTVKYSPTTLKSGTN